MSDNLNQQTFINGTGGTLRQGEVLRMTTIANTVLRGDAVVDPAGFVGVALSGVVGPGGPVNAVTSGAARVLLEAGLTPAASDALYVSATTPGRATNVPTPGVVIGEITDASKYAATGTVEAIITGAGASGSAGGGGGIIRVDSINVVGTKLTALVTAGFQKATLAFVGNSSVDQASVNDFFQLAIGENLTADGITVVNSPTAGHQWKRMFVVNQSFVKKDFWAIDDGASPENTGWGATLLAADAHPIPSAELRRRLTGSNYDTTPIFHQLTDADPNVWATIDTVKTKNGLGFPNYVGSKTAQVGGTDVVITAVQVAVPATNTARSISGLNLGAAGFVGLMIQRTDGGKTAFATRSAGANQMEIGEVRTSNALTGDNGAVTNFIVGEHVTVYKLPTIPCHPFSGNEMFVGVGEVEVKNPSPVIFEQGNMGGSYPFYTNCSFDGAVFGGGAFVFLGNSLFRTRQSIVEGGNLQFQTLSVLTQGQGIQFTGNSNVIFGNEVLIQNSSINFARGCTALQSTGDLGIFNCAGIGINGQGQGQYAKTAGAIYGAGNTNFLFSVIGSIWEIFSGSATAVTTSSAISAGGRAYNFADLPLIDEATGTFVIDRSVSRRRTSSVNFTGSITTNNAATQTSYLANPGTALAVANQTLAQEFVTSKRQFEVMRFIKLIAGGSVAITVTLYKSTGGGALGATAMQISIPAADPVRTRYAITSQTIQFVDGDTYAVRFDSPIDAAPGLMAGAVTLE